MEVSYNEAEKLNDNIAERLYYIAKLNPRGVNKLAYKHGYPVPKENLQSKFNFLSLYFSENGSEDKALDELLITHPDFQWFAETMASKMAVPTRMAQVESDGYLPIEQFGNYDGFIDNNDNYNDPFIGGIISAVGNLGAAGISKIGAGKDRATSEKLAQESTKQAQVQVDIAKAQGKSAQKQAAEKRKTYIWIAVIVIVVAVAIAGGIWWYKNSKK